MNTIKKNKIGICQWSIPVDGPYLCKFISEIGYDGVQLDIGQYDRGFPLSHNYLQNIFLEEAKKYNIEFPSITIRECDFYNMFAQKNSKDSEVISTGIYKAIDVASNMNIPIVMIPQFGKSAIETKEILETAIQMYKEICDYASDKGIIIATENLMDPTDLEYFFSKVDKQNLKLYFDTQNYHINKGYDTPKLLPDVFKYICQVHVKDGLEGELSGELLGKGVTKFHESMEKLKSMKYKGWYVVENYYDRKPLINKYKDSIEIMKLDLHTIKKYIY